MPIYQVGEIWYLDIRPKNGPRIRRSTGTTDRQAAQEYHDQIKAGTWRQDRLGEAPRVTWGDAVAKWLKVKERGLPDRYRINKLTIPLSSPLPLSASALDSSLTGLQPGTHNRLLALIVAIHNCAGVPPVKLDRKPNPQGRTRWLTAEEWKRLKRALHKESPLLEQAAEFTLATGLRENNVLNLEWEQVDLKRRVAWIYGDQAKAGHPIGVPLNDAAMGILAIRRGVDNVLVFGNPDYSLYKASNRAWYAAVGSAGLRGFRWHDLRHTWASWAVMSGVRLEELMKLGGWKSYSMVARYAHLSPEHLAGVAAKVRPISRKAGKLK